MGLPLHRIVDELVARVTSGPMQFRLIVQPMMAALLGIRDGRHDATAGIPPLIWALVSDAQSRKDRLKSVLYKLCGPILVASVVDGVVQFLMFGHVRPVTAIVVGTLLMGLPYSAARGISNRLCSGHKVLETKTPKRDEAARNRL